MSIFGHAMSDRSTLPAGHDLDAVLNTIAMSVGKRWQTQTLKKRSHRGKRVVYVRDPDDDRSEFMELLQKQNGRMDEKIDTSREIERWGRVSPVNQAKLSFVR
jgi:hypothetical protein